MSLNRVAFKVHGAVQGVGFRDFTEKRAVEFGLKGWVKNNTSGEVEGEAQGDGDSLQKFFQHVNKGPRLAHVTKVEKKDLPPQEEDGQFAVRRTSESIVDFSS